jgi:hypothetical protein
VTFVKATHLSLAEVVEGVEKVTQGNEVRDE